VNLQHFRHGAVVSREETTNKVPLEPESAGFLARLAESASVLEAVINKGYTNWIITFSGGKDSTTTLIVALETALRLSQIERIDVVYSDTRLEVPIIRQYALSFLEYITKSQRFANLPLKSHVLYPAIDESFWTCLLGKGYPPPHQRFRWCTRRLKIQPVANALMSFIQPNRTVILTGVRFSESQHRNARLHQSCRRGGECGQGLWFQYSSRHQVAYLAPIVDWKECDVWDFLQFYAPALGYPTKQLEESVYNGRDTRFGCWMCTVVRQDKAMEKITSRPQWSHLRPLLDFRQRVIELTRAIESRVLRSDGKPGRLTLEMRQRLLREVLELQTAVGMEIVSHDEIEAIRKYWEKEVS
jgi:DNA sulfur modification protein DndC